MSEKTTRDTVAKLMAEQTAEEPAEAGQDATTEAGGAEVEAEAAGAPEAAAGEQEGAPAEKPAPQPSERARTPDGKFAAAAGELAKPTAGAAAQPKPHEQQKVALPELKAPANWTPKAKEEFPKLPRVVQEEAIRLHLEVNKTLQETANARQAADAFQRTVAPYEHMFRAAGKSPIEGVGWLMQQYAALQTAPMQQRAAIIAALQRDFVGTDEAAIKLLSAALDGTPPQPGAIVSAALRPEQIQAMVREEAVRMQGEGQRQAEVRAIQEFEASAPEFLANLTKEITAIVSIEKRQGNPITVEMLKSAYERAKQLNPETAAILKQRDDAAKAKENAAAAAKKRAAASGIKNEPAGPAGAPAKAMTTRDAVKRQAERLSRL